MIRPDPETRRARLARVLARFAETTGDGRARTAAAILTGARQGRRGHDDAKVLAYAHRLHSTGIAKSVNQACTMAAEAFAPYDEMEVTRDRLRRKFRANLVAAKTGENESLSSPEI